MFSSKRWAFVPILFLAAVLSLFLTPFSVDRLRAQPTSGQLKVYLLTGRDTVSDLAMFAALRDAGYAVDLGTDTASFDGSQAELEQYDVVVVLNHANWSAAIPSAGLQALRGYLAAGGAVVLGEWFVWKGLLSDLLPVESCGYNSAEETTYTRNIPTVAVNDGLPLSFRFSLSRFSGSEGCLRPRPGAMVLYRSSNGGGITGSAGVAAWNAGAGRVVSVSNLLAANEMQSEHMRRLLQNIVGWVAAQQDITAPQLERFTINVSETLHNERRIQLNTFARDSGGSGLGSIYIIEYTLTTGSRPRFRPVARSGWLPYASSINLQWTLANQPGLHYLQVWVADRAGNVSGTPLSDFVSYFHGSAAIAQGDRVVYRLKPKALEQMTISMEALSGDPDLYVYNANGDKISADLFTASTETASFIADGGVYQIEIEGLADGRYYLETSDELLARRIPPLTPGPVRPPALKIGTVPPTTGVVLPAAPTSRTIELFVPMVQQ
jgi:hypothetical protein